MPRLIDITTGKPFTRRSALKGLAAIIAAGVSPSVVSASTGGLRRGLGARLGMMGETLPYDAEVEWLSSSYRGGQYIYIDAFATKVETQFKFNSIPSSNGYVYIKWPTRFKGVYRNGIGRFAYQYGDAWNSESTNKNIDTNIHQVIQTETRVFISDVIDRSHSPVGVNSKTAMNIFALSGSGEYADVRIYYLKTYNDSEVEYDFIPVRVGQVGYMYDRAHPDGGPLGNGLYPNAGTGSFVLGPDKT